MLSSVIPTLNAEGSLAETVASLRRAEHTLHHPVGRVCRLRQTNLPIRVIRRLDAEFYVPYRSINRGMSSTKLHGLKR